MSYIYIVMNENTDAYDNVTSEVCSAWSTAALAMQELADIAAEHDIDFEGGVGDSVILPPAVAYGVADEYYVLTLGVDEN